MTPSSKCPGVFEGGARTDEMKRQKHPAVATKKELVRLDVLMFNPTLHDFIWFHIIIKSIQAKWRFSPKSELNFSGIFSRTWDVRAAAVRVGWHGNQQFQLRKMRESVHRNHWKALQKRRGRLCEFWADEFCRRIWISKIFGLKFMLVFTLFGRLLPHQASDWYPAGVTYLHTKNFFLQVILFRSVWRVSTRRNFKLQSSPAGEEPGGGKPCGSWGKATFTGTDLCTTWAHLSVATPLAKWSKWETFPGDTKRNMVVLLHYIVHACQSLYEIWASSILEGCQLHENGDSQQK